MPGLDFVIREHLWAMESQTSLRLCRPQDQGLGGRLLDMMSLHKTWAHGGSSSFCTPHENMVGGLDPTQLPSRIVYFYFFALSGEEINSEAKWVVLCRSLEVVTISYAGITEGYLCTPFGGRYLNFSSGNAQTELTEFWVPYHPGPTGSWI